MRRAAPTTAPPIMDRVEGAVAEAEAPDLTGAAGFTGGIITSTAV